MKYKKRKEIGSGYTSKAYLLDNKYIQLVGKNQESFEIYKDLKFNSELLDGKITCVDYPHNMTLIEQNEEYPYSCLLYPIVKGSSLKVEKISSTKLEDIAKKIIEFNKELHNSNIHWDRESAIKHELGKIDNNIEILIDYLTNK